MDRLHRTCTYCHTAPLDCTSAGFQIPILTAAGSAKELVSHITATAQQQSLSELAYHCIGARCVVLRLTHYSNSNYLRLSTSAYLSIAAVLSIIDRPHDHPSFLAVHLLILLPPASCISNSHLDADLL